MNANEPDRALRPAGASVDPGPRAPERRTIRLEGPPPPPVVPSPPPLPGSSTGADPLAAWLRQPGAASRLEALRRVGEDLGAARTQMLLDTLASDASARVRLAAVRLFHTRPRDERVRAAALALGDPDATVRAAGIGLLDARSGRSAAVLVRALRDTDPEVVRRAAGALAGSHHPAALAILWAAAKDAHDAIREPVVDAIESFADAARTLARAALESLDDSERACGIAVLARLGDDDLRAVVSTGVADTSAAVRSAALKAVTGAPGVDVDAVGARVHDPDETVRKLTVAALRDIDDDRVLAYLIDACHDPVRAVRTAAQSAIVDRCSVPLVRLLIRALGKPNLRQTASQLLARMGPVAARELVDAIDEADVGTRAVIGEILKAAGAMRSLLIDLRDHRPERRRRAMEAVAVMEARRAVEPLIERLEDPDGMVRARAAAILAELGDERAQPALTRVASFDPDVEVVAAAELALRRLERPHAERRSN